MRLDEEECQLAEDKAVEKARRLIDESVARAAAACALLARTLLAAGLQLRLRRARSVPHRGAPARLRFVGALSAAGRAAAQAAAPPCGQPPSGLLGAVAKVL